MFGSTHTRTPLICGVRVFIVQWPRDAPGASRGLSSAVPPDVRGTSGEPGTGDLEGRRQSPVLSWKPAVLGGPGFRRTHDRGADAGEQAREGRPGERDVRAALVGSRAGDRAMERAQADRRGATLEDLDRRGKRHGGADEGRIQPTEIGREGCDRADTVGGPRPASSAGTDSGGALRCE